MGKAIVGGLVVLALGFVLALAALRVATLAPPVDDGAPVSYEVTGDGITTATLVYEADRGVTQMTTAADLPWTLTRRGVRTGDFLYVSAQNTGGRNVVGGGCVTVRVRVGYVIVKQAHSCGTGAIATASGSR